METTHICPQTPIGSCLVKASLVLLSTSMVWEWQAWKQIHSVKVLHILVRLFYRPTPHSTVNTGCYPQYQNLWYDQRPLRIKPKEDIFSYLAILNGLPLFNDSTSASISWSLSIRSANLFRSLDLSKPVTFLPHEVLKALRAAATAMSMSFTEPDNHRASSISLIF